MKKIFLLLSVGLIFILTGCQSPFTNKSADTSKVKTPEAAVNKTGGEPVAGLANPASVNCTEKGGKLEIRKNKPGEYGVCLFEDNRQCEEWALLRGQCPVGGVKITGYDSEAQVYCAITGGQVEDVDTPVPMCKRVDGTFCNAQSNLDGECPDPNDSNPNAGNAETK